MSKTFIFLPLVVLVTTTDLIAQKSSEYYLEQQEQRIKSIESIVKEFSYLKVSGYVQGQYQLGQEDANLRVGTNYDKSQCNSRIGMRRSRVKVTYNKGLASAVFQIDATERKVGVKDAYIDIHSPWKALGRSALRIGIFDRPFGHEISYSSSLRESPERSAIINNLFPDERDMGAMLIVQPPTQSRYHFLRLEAGLFAGNAVQLETDSRLDFIGHLMAKGKWGQNSRWGVGTSYYYGYRQVNSDNIYTPVGNAFALNSNSHNIGTYAPRRYWGIDAQVSISNPLGTTQVRGEYIVGKQSSSANSFRSHNTSSATSGDTYVRPFTGGYAILIHQIAHIPLSLVLKYDWLDPNTQLRGDELGLSHSTASDVAQSTLGMGLLWSIDNNLRLQAYYEYGYNERTRNLTNYTGDRKDNVFTLRLQYKF